MPDDQLEIALDVMGEMVFAPAFAELDAEREVVLEEIAMYEDQPQELVHDLISEATFGTHPLGRPVIGTRGRDLERRRGGDLGLPPNDVRRPETSSSPRPGTSSTRSSSACCFAGAAALRRAGPEGPARTAGRS